MPYYFTRSDLMDQATTTYGVVETGFDGSAAGPIRVPQGVTRVVSIRASYVMSGASITGAGILVVLKLAGAAVKDGVPELVLWAYHDEQGGGTVTAAVTKSRPIAFLPVNIPLKSGNDLSLSAAYYGADAGDGFLAVTLELV